MMQLSQKFNLIVFQSVLRAWNKFGQFCVSNYKNKTQGLLLCNEYVIKLPIVKKLQVVKKIKESVLNLQTCSLLLLKKKKTQPERRCI